MPPAAFTDSDQPADVLEQLHTAERLGRIDRVLAARLGSVTAVFEHIDDPRNVGACLRSCDAYGIQDVHVISGEGFDGLRGAVPASADRWLDVHRYRDTPNCLERLRAAGFVIWAADLEAAVPLDQLPLAPRVALVFGNEHDGVSTDMRAAADQRFILPMRGMVQSFNISVAAAIALQTVVPNRVAELGGEGDLDPERIAALRRRWLEYGIRNATQVRRAYGDPQLTGPADAGTADPGQVSAAPAAGRAPKEQA